MSDWLGAMRLSDITLFCQDWGGLIGLRLVAAFPDRFARVVVANTGLPTGEGFTDAFMRWLEFSQNTPTLPIGQIVSMGCRRGLSEAEKAAYDAPFPDESFKAGARRFPALVPVTPQHGVRRREQGRVEGSGGFHQALSDGVQRFGSGDQGRRGALSGARSGSQGPKARDHHGRRPLPAGG